MLEKITETINHTITNIVIAIMIVLIGFIIGKIIDITLTKIFGELEVDKNLRTKKRRTNIEKVLPKSIAITIYIASVILALAHLQIINLVLKTTIYVLFIIALGTIILSTLDIIPNIIGHIQIKKTIKKDDIIQTKLVKGKVKKIGLLSTQIIDNKNNLFHIPNSYLHKNKIKKTSNKS